jgi:hypothetical protein
MIAAAGSAFDAHRDFPKGTARRLGMGGMEFTSRMVATLIWPAVVIVAVLVFRKWIIERLESLGITVGSLTVNLKALNSKVDTVGENISTTLADNMPQPAGDGIPESLVDLMATVNKNRMEGIQAAFDLVYQTLKENYPQLRRVLPSQLPEAMQALVDKGEMEPDVALSVRQLYELLVMPEWQKEQAGDTRGYAFLMLAEGAIHGILRSAQARSAPPSQETPVSAPAAISASWSGTYDDRFPIELHIDSWSNGGFTGTMTYPDGNTTTSVTGTAEDEADGVRLTWAEHKYVTPGRRSIEFDGNYTAIVSDGIMTGAWYRANRRIAGFRMTSSGGTASAPLPAEQRAASR